MELWSTQVKVEGIMLKAVWHWGSDGSVINDPFGEPGQAQWYVGLLSMWASWTVTVCFSPISWEISLTGDSWQMYVN